MKTSTIIKALCVALFLLFVTNGVVMAQIHYDSTGNVGIGKTSPGYDLDVAGDINFTGSLYKNGSALLEQEAWQAPTLLNNWRNLHFSLNPAGYFKDSMGIVHLRGTVCSGSGTIFILPVGYRPEHLEIHPIISNSNSFACCQISASGGVGASGGSSYTLDGVTFRASGS